MKIHTSSIIIFITVVLSVTAIVVSILFPKPFIVKDNLDKDYKIDSLNKINIELRLENSSIKDSLFNVIAQRDSIQIVADSVIAENFVYQYKIGRIKNYLNIVKNNSTQSKYLRGWITRVIEQ